MHRQLFSFIFWQNQENTPNVMMLKTYCQLLSNMEVHTILVGRHLYIRIYGVFLVFYTLFVVVLLHTIIIFRYFCPRKTG